MCVLHCKSISSLNLVANQCKDETGFICLFTQRTAMYIYITDSRFWNVLYHMALSFELSFLAVGFWCFVQSFRLWHKFQEVFGQLIMFKSTVRDTLSQTNIKKKTYSIYDHYPFKHYSGFYFKISKTGNCS